jgi:hypothetical protein
VAMIGAEAAARSADQVGNGRLSAEAALRFRVAQATGVLALVHPESGQVVVFDADQFLRIDFRLILGESIQLIQFGHSLRIVFADGAVIELLHFFDEGVSPPSDLVAQIDDATYLSPALFFREYSAADSKVKVQAAPIGSGGSAGDTLPVSLLREGPLLDGLPDAAIVTGPFLPSLPVLPDLIISFPEVVGPLPLPPLPELPPLPPVPPLPPNIPPASSARLTRGR